MDHWMTMRAVVYFRHRRLHVAVDTIGTTRCICTLSYFSLILYIAQADGNPFLNFFFQSCIEFPAYFLGSWMGKLLCAYGTFSFIFYSCTLWTIGHVNCNWHD